MSRASSKQIDEENELRWAIERLMIAKDKCNRSNMFLAKKLVEYDINTSQKLDTSQFLKYLDIYPKKIP